MRQSKPLYSGSKILCYCLILKVSSFGIQSHSEIFDTNLSVLAPVHLWPSMFLKTIDHSSDANGELQNHSFNGKQWSSCTKTINYFGKNHWLTIPSCSTWIPLLWSIQPTVAVAPGVGEGTRRKRRKGRVAARQGPSSRLRGGFKSRRFYSHKLITCLPVDCQLEGATPGNKELANPAPWNESDVSNWFAECVVARRKIAILRPSLVHHIFQAQCFALSGGVHAILRMHMFCGTLLLKYILNV